MHLGSEGPACPWASQTKHPLLSFISWSFRGRIPPLREGRTKKQAQDLSTSRGSDTVLSWHWRNLCQGVIFLVLKTSRCATSARAIYPSLIIAFLAKHMSKLRNYFDHKKFRTGRVRKDQEAQAHHKKEGGCGLLRLLREGARNPRPAGDVLHAYRAQNVSPIHRQARDRQEKQPPTPRPVTRSSKRCLNLPDAQNFSSMHDELHKASTRSSMWSHRGGPTFNRELPVKPTPLLGVVAIIFIKELSDKYVKDFSGYNNKVGFWEMPRS